MPDDDLSNCLKNLWTEMRRDPFQISPDRLRRDAQGLKTRMRWVLVMYGVVTLSWSSLYVFLLVRMRLDWLQRIGFVMLSIATLVFPFVLIHRLGLWPNRGTPAAGQIDCIRFYRATLLRIRDYRRGWWPLVQMMTLSASALLVIAGSAQAAPEIAILLWLGAVVHVALMALLARRFRRRTRIVQRRIDALDELLKTKK